MMAALLLAALALLPAAALALPNPPPRATAGVAGGAGAAELAERGGLAGNGSVLAVATARPGTAGTIREALGGGVVEQPTPSASFMDPPVGPPPGRLRTSGSRCTSPQVCLKVELCPPMEVDLLFECAPGWVCCVPAATATTSSTSTAPPAATTSSPRPRPPQSHAPVAATTPSAQWQSQPPRPTPSHAAPQEPHYHGHDNGHVHGPVYGQDHGPVHGQDHVHVTASLTSSPPTSPRPRPPQSHAPVAATPPPAQWQPQPARPTAPQAAPHEHHGHDHFHGQAPQQPQRPLLQMNPEEGIAVPVQQPQPQPPPRPGQQVTAPPPPTKVAFNSTPSPTTPAPADDIDSESLLPGLDVCGKVSTENRITNGKIASPGQFPWMAILGYKRRGESSVSFLCGGTLINDKYVLTAAHCISSQNRPVLVRLGEFNLTEAVDCDHNKVCAPPPLDMDVEEITPHHGFNLRNIKHDIALIRLRRSVPEYSEFVRPICLPEGISVPDDKKFKIAGWGKTYFRDAAGSPVLQFTDVNGVGHAECNELQPPELQPLDPGQLCAGGDKGKDACKGDSGGPLMVTQVAELASGPELLTYQVGVVSYGPDSPCGTAPLPSIYTRVAAYMPWIYAVLRP